jgi:DNA-binding transcriptional regulator YiaG
MVPVGDALMTPSDFKAARKTLGLTQAKLAEIIRMSGVYAPDTIRKWESGALGIPGYALVILDLALNVPAARKRLGISN